LKNNYEYVFQVEAKTKSKQKLLEEAKLKEINRFLNKMEDSLNFIIEFNKKLDQTIEKYD
tara:strand:- start:304 stop:483 length:180 start_codon:yes stop_codon:yes gene_type:complete